MKNSNNLFIVSLLFLLPYQCIAKTIQKQSAQQPNIIVIIADDLGWGDTATYGNRVIKTPNLDILAKQGVKFNQGYAAAGVCSPSRSAILTGRTPYRNGVWRHLSGPSGPAHLRKSEITYPKLLQRAGYETGHFGKWHLLSESQFNSSAFPQPSDHGFDYWFATQNNAAPSHKNPNNFVRNGNEVGELTGYSAPLVADEAIHWLEDKRDPGKPFLMSVWFHEPHAPIATDINFAELYPNETPQNKKYYGNISQMDYALGKIMKALDAQGVSDNTFVVFTSDNGPVVKFGGNSGGLRGYKRYDFEGGIRVPFLVRWPGHIKANSESNIPVIGTDIFTTVLKIVDLPVPLDRTIDGVNLLPAIENKKLVRKTPLFWRTHVSPYDNRVALRDGDWKIVADDTMSNFKLFNVEKDYNEEVDLAVKMPEKFASMKQLLVKTWKDISSEGPNQWWEGESGNIMSGAILRY
jgi:arylsulfatase A-like enzyme